MKHLLKKVNSLNDIQFICLSIFICLLISLLSSVVASFFYTNIHETFHLFPSFAGNLVAMVLVGPFVETLLLWGFKTLLSKFIDNKTVILFIMAISFGLLHCYSVWYIITIIPMGLIFCYALLFYPCKKSNPFCVTWCIHAVYNLISLLINLF